MSREAATSVRESGDRGAARTWRRCSRELTDVIILLYASTGIAIGYNRCLFCLLQLMFFATSITVELQPATVSTYLLQLPSDLLPSVNDFITSITAEL